MLLQFVILHHTGIDEPHFDLMFEASPGSPLSTWRSPTWPIERPTVLVRLSEHRRDYLDYQGAVSRRRGEVQRVARGMCSIERGSDDSCWTIHFSDLTIAPLSIKLVERDQWLAVPSCGGG